MGDGDAGPSDTNKGPPKREVEEEQRPVCEQAHGVELDPLQLPDIPEGGGGATSALAAVIKAAQAPLTIIDDQSEDDGGFIEEEVNENEDELEEEDGSNSH